MENDRAGRAMGAAGARARGVATDEDIRSRLSPGRGVAMLSAGRARVLGSPAVLVMLASIRELEYMRQAGIVIERASVSGAPRMMERDIDPWGSSDSSRRSRVESSRRAARARVSGPARLPGSTDEPGRLERARRVRELAPPGELPRLSSPVDREHREPVRARPADLGPRKLGEWSV